MTKRVWVPKQTRALRRNAQGRTAAVRVGAPYMRPAQIVSPVYVPPSMDKVICNSPVWPAPPSYVEFDADEVLSQLVCTNRGEGYETVASPRETPNAPFEGPPAVSAEETGAATPVCPPELVEDEGGVLPPPACHGYVPVNPVALPWLVQAPLPDATIGGASVRPSLDDGGGLVGVLKRLCLSCTGNGDLVEDWDADVKFRNQVSIEMSYSRNTDGASAPDHVAVANGMHTLAPDHVVREVPAFATSVALALRMKLGAGAMVDTPDNRAVVRRETVRLLREYNVRTADAAAHMDVIENAFFNDRTHGRAARWRSRGARRSPFVKWLIGNEQPSHDW